MLLTMMMQFSMTSVKHGSTSNAIVNQNFLTFIGNNNTITSNETKHLNSSLLLKPPPDLALFLISLTVFQLGWGKFTPPPKLFFTTFF